MRILGIYLMATMFAISGFSQDYFWVGDGGNWSDLSHWATTSGGDTFHTELPGPGNDVYFDAHSFTKPHQVVTIDLEESHCRNFTAKGVLHAPTIRGVGFYDKLNVYGDLYMTDEMKRSFTMIYMMSDTLANVTTGELALGGFIQFVGGGTFHLNDSVSVNNFYVYDSDLYTNDHPIYASARIYALNGKPVFDLGRSNVYTNMWRVLPDTELNADSATIYFGSANSLRDFFGGRKHYHRVVFTGEVRLFDNNTFDVFEALPGADIMLAAGSVQTAGEFVLNGSAIQSISLKSSQTGSQASLSQSDGVVDATYLLLQDNAAIGGAEFNALESIDLGNNTGWNISITEPQDYFWVGGAGNWEDANHWATTSGGDQLHDAPPSALDNVFFDEHSGLEEGDVVALGMFNWSCNNFTLNNISQTARINQTGSGTLNVYGNFIAEGGVIFSLSGVNFLSEEEVTLSVSTGSLGEGCTMRVNVLGDFQLHSPLLVRSLILQNGNFFANGNNITALFELNIGQAFSGFADLSGIDMEVRLFNNFSSSGALNINNTNITSSGVFHSNDLDYHNITFVHALGSPTLRVTGNFSVEEMIVLPGTILELQAGATIITGSLSLEGTSDAPIEIISTVPGTEAFLSQSTGTVNGNHLILKDNHALGGATFIANNSELKDNVVGWDVNTSTRMAQHVHPDQMYPNPASDQIQVKGTAGETFRIFDLSGRLIQSLPLNDGWNRIDVGSLTPGVYVTQTSGMHREETERLVVHR